MVGEDERELRRAVDRVREAGLDLEEARALVVLRAEVAIAAGAELAAVAAAAGVRPATLRLWLTGQQRA